MDEKNGIDLSRLKDDADRWAKEAERARTTYRAALEAELRLLNGIEPIVLGCETPVSSETIASPATSPSETSHVKMTEEYWRSMAHNGKVAKRRPAMRQPIAKVHATTGETIARYVAIIHAVDDMPHIDRRVARANIVEAAKYDMEFAGFRWRYLPGGTTKAAKMRDAK